MPGSQCFKLNIELRTLDIAHQLSNVVLYSLATLYDYFSHQRLDGYKNHKIECTYSLVCEMSKKYVHNINIRIDPNGIQLFGQKLVKGAMPLDVEEHVRCLVMCRGNDGYFDFDQVRYCYPQANETNPIIQPIKTNEIMEKNQLYHSK
jgi:hypothetical protein